MYKARLCSSQEIPPHASRFPCSELLRGASEGAPATSAQVSGKPEVRKWRGALKEQNRAGGLRNPAATTAVWPRASPLIGPAAAHCPPGCALAMDPITSLTGSLSMQQFLVKSNYTNFQLDFLMLRKKKKKEVSLLIFSWSRPFRRRSGRRFISLPSL